MNNEIADKRIKEKVESVDTLEGGIVFGKEEAWEKLQARMEAKPTPKLVPFYRLAAAAVLLLIVCIAVLYRAPEVNSIVHDNKPITAPETTTIKTTPEITTSPLTQPATKQKSSTLVANKDVATQLLTPPVVPQPIILQVADTMMPEPALVVVQPVAPKPEMRVVHINETDQPAEAPAKVSETTTYNPPSFVIFSNKVVHINEVINEEREERQYHRNSRVSVGITFMHPPLHRGAPAMDNDNYAHSFLKINLN